MGADPRSWGRAEWLRGLPTVGVLLYDPARAVFTREGRPFPAPPLSAEFGGPLGDAPMASEPAGERRCAKVESVAPGTLPLAESLRSLEPGFTGDGRIDPAIHAGVMRRLTTRLQASIAELPREDFDILYSFGEALRCALTGASADEAAAMWNEMERVLATEPATPFAGAIIAALRERPAPAPQMQRILRVLDEHPRCGVRTGALSLRSAVAADEVSRASLAPLAQGALRSSCWRLQAQALTVLKRLGVAPGADAALPSFLPTRAAEPR